jgi:branched-chain amino acid transport system permease protein
MQEGLRAFKGAQEIAFGLLLMLCIIFLPEGLISFLKRHMPGWSEPLRRPDARSDAPPNAPR